VKNANYKTKSKTQNKSRRN